MNPQIQMPVPDTTEIWNELARRHAKMHQALRAERAEPESARKTEIVRHLCTQMILLRDLGRFVMGVPADSGNPFGDGEDF